mgnify:FL=1
MTRLTVATAFLILSIIGSGVCFTCTHLAEKWAANQLSEKDHIRTGCKDEPRGTHDRKQVVMESGRADEENTHPHQDREGSDSGDLFD